MIASLSGRLRQKSTSGAVIECAGVGYGVAMSLTSLSELGAEGEDVEVLVHTHVAQDSLRLYGFTRASERQTFEVLIGTTGVGPKLALAILSAVSAEELSEIVSCGDKLALTRIPGVGGKKAERLLLELKGRLPEVAASADAGSASVLADVVSALVNLGFSLEVADKSARAALAKNPDEESIATLVRAALQKTRGS